MAASLQPSPITVCHLRAATFSTDRTPEGLVYSETCRMVYFGKSAKGAVRYPLGYVRYGLVGRHVYPISMGTRFEARPIRENIPRYIAIRNRRARSRNARSPPSRMAQTALRIAWFSKPPLM